MIVDPFGDVLAEGGKEEELLVVEIDPSLPAKVREKLPALADRRRDLF